MKTKILTALALLTILAHYSRASSVDEAVCRKRCQFSNRQRCLQTAYGPKCETVGNYESCVQRCVQSLTAQNAVKSETAVAEEDACHQRCGGMLRRYCTRNARRFGGVERCEQKKSYIMDRCLRMCGKRTANVSHNRKFS